MASSHLLSAISESASLIVRVREVVDETPKLWERAIMAAYVVKIEYENNLRRLTFQNQPRDEDLSFERLEIRVRELFQLANTAKLVVTYTDRDNDVVTMANDHDLKDALVHQSLNPLRLRVTLDKSKGSLLVGAGDNASGVDTERVDVQLKDLIKKVSSTREIEAVKNVVQSYEQLFSKVTTPAQIRSLVENLVLTITSQLSHAMRSEVITSYEPLIQRVTSPAQIKGLVDNLVQTVQTISSQITTAVRKEVKDVMGSRSSANLVTFRPGSSLGNESQRSAVPVCSVDGPDGQSRDAGQTQIDNDGVGTAEVVHHGVTCDICGLSPIVGLRWKSIKKFDYDLCSSCFQKHGHVDEYSKIDQPMFRPRHLHSQRMVRMSPAVGPMCQQAGPGFRGGKPFGLRGALGGRFGPMAVGIYGGKLDARFVRDVTMFDGTEVAPGTHFTKIWRLRNSGAVPWPAQTKLVHVGGDELGQSSTVRLEILEEGLAPEREIEVSVDLVAPQKPGRYVSHWRLASPHGPKFGHRVWVLIQVVPAEAFGPPTGIKTLSVPDETPVQSGTADQKVESVAVSEETLCQKGESVPASTPSAEASADGNQGGVRRNSTLETAMSFVNVEVPTAEEVIEPSEVAENEIVNIDAETQRVVENPSLEGFSLVDKPSAATVVDKEDSQPSQGIAEESKMHAEVSIVENESEAYQEQGGTLSDAQVPQTSSSSSEADVLKNAPEAGPSAEDKLSTPDALLAKLESMGFTDSKLNLELLEKNNLDLRKTLDDLCSAEEWDPILEELEEMGFYDTNMNRRLLFKNNGSVKRVVKDLVQMDRQLSGKGKMVE